MQSLSTEGFPAYHEGLLRSEMELFRQWLLWRHLGGSWSTADQRHWESTVALLCQSALQQPQVFVHRDYHSRNLMLLRSGETMGVLDFQDAVRGPILYDVVSLLKDCYIKLSGSLRTRLLEHFVTLSTPSLSTAFADSDLVTQFDRMGAQRQLKAAGIFARLYHRDGKAGYLADVPRTLSYIVDAAAGDPGLEWIANLVQTRVLPQLQQRLPPA